MRAAIYQGPQQIEITQVAEPICSKDGLILRVEACGLCGSDLRTFYKGTSYVPPGTIMGHEVAGVVHEVGPEVEGYKIGDRMVVGPIIPCGECHYCRRGLPHLCANEESIAGTLPGGFAEYMLITAKVLKWGSISIIPDKLSFEEASLAEPLSSVVKTQEMLNISEGEIVVVIGAGPVGCMHTELARARGASRIIQIDISPERVKAASRFGATVVVDASAEDPVKRVFEETQGRGADVVICAAPSTLAASQGVMMAASGGRVSWFAGLPSEDPFVKVDGNSVHYKDISIIGTIGFAPHHFHRALDLILSRKIDGRKYISGKVPLEKLVESIEIVHKGGAMKFIILPQLEPPPPNEQ